MRPTRTKRVSAWNRIAIAVSTISVILLITLFAVDRQQSNLLAQELSEMAKQQDLDEQAFLDMVNTEYASDIAVVSQYLPGIVCWGDSLTAGAGGDGVTYPNVLRSLIQTSICDQYDLKASLDSKYTYLMDPTDYTFSIPVVNMGVGGENSITIVGRNGAIPYIVSEALTIPADATPVEIHFTSKSGQIVSPLRQQHSGVNPVTIGGVEGTLSIHQNTWESKEYSYTFTRTVSGESKTIQPGTELVTAASQQYLNYVTVIFIGQNGGYANTEDLIGQQRAIIDHQTANQDRFIIVGLHTGTEESRRELEEAMQEEYGDQYINLRQYMSTQAMADAGLNPTAEDTALMEQGATPYSFMTDDRLHFNSVGYELIGNLIYNRMEDLGYFEEIQIALGNNFN